MSFLSDTTRPELLSKDPVKQLSTQHIKFATSFYFLALLCYSLCSSVAGMGDSPVRRWGSCRPVRDNSALVRELACLAGVSIDPDECCAARRRREEKTLVSVGRRRDIIAGVMMS